MQVSVRSGFGFIQIPGTDYLSIAGSGAVDVNIDKLEPQEKIQLYKELHFGRLVVPRDKKTEEEVKALNDFCKELQEQAAETIPEVKQRAARRQEEVKSVFDETLEGLRVDARRLLKKTIPFIKKEARKMKPRELEVLIGEEKVWKNRKNLVPVLEAMLSELKHAVPQNLLGVSRADEAEIEKSFDVTSRHDSFGGLVSKVIEEEEEEVIIKCDGG